MNTLNDDAKAIHETTFSKLFNPKKKPKIVSYMDSLSMICHGWRYSKPGAGQPHYSSTK